MAQARGRLVEQERGGLAGQRTGDLDDALLAERQRRRRRGGLRREAAALDLPARLGEQGGFLGAVEAQHGGDPAEPAAAMRAERHVLEHAALRQQPHVLERAAEPARRELA